MFDVHQYNRVTIVFSNQLLPPLHPLETNQTWESILKPEDAVAATSLR